MTRTLFAGVALAAALFTTAVTGTTAWAADAMTKAGDLTIHAPWARASAGMARAGAAFMTITNTGAADRLISASADKGKRVELHTHIKEGEVMRMRQVPAIDVPAQGQVDLKPGSYHVMFMGLAAPFKEGETFPLTLTFEKAGDVTVTVSVKGAGAMGAGMKMKMEMGHDQMDHSKMPMMKKDN